MEKAKYFIPKPAEKIPELKSISSMTVTTIVMPPKPKPVKRSFPEEIPLFSDAKQPKKLHELQKEKKMELKSPIKSTELKNEIPTKPKKEKPEKVEKEVKSSKSHKHHEKPTIKIEEEIVPTASIKHEEKPVKVETEKPSTTQDDKDKKKHKFRLPKISEKFRKYVQGIGFLNIYFNMPYF
jgi:hypothetical protein